MRIGSLISGVIATVAGLALLLAGGALVVIDDEKDPDGYLTTSTAKFSTETSALATEKIDVDLEEAGWFIGTEDFDAVRVRVESDTDKPVFVGVARTDDAERYLDGAATTTLTDVEVDPFAATTKDHFGKRKLDRPGRQRIWEASTTGTGTQNLKWDMDDGEWSIVVMNADGSPGVEASVSAGAKLGDLQTIGLSTMGGGGLLLIAGAALLVVSGRPKRPRPVATVKVPAPLGS